MNGNGRLTRSTTNAMLGGVAAGLGHYLNIDPTFVRIVFLGLMFVTGGGFFLVYLALWLLIPAEGSTLTDASQVMRENVDEMKAKVRSLTSGTSSQSANGNPGAATGNGSAVANGNPGDPNASQAQLPQGGSTTQARTGFNPQILIWAGVFFLALNLGIFHAIHWGMWWPLLLVGLGVIMLSRKP